ncbi:MAG: THUMP domain-containing protein [Myxococcota bacterium]
MVTVELTTNPGLEDLTLDEFGVRAAARGFTVTGSERCPDGLAGHVLVEVEAPWTALNPVVQTLRSAHRAIRWLDAFPLRSPDPLAQIRAAMSAVVPRIAELDHPDRSFRVTSSRTGPHPFTSEDVQRVAGAGVRAVTPHPVSLEAFDVELRCDVRGDVCRIGVQLGGLSRRPKGPYTQRTSLRGNVAWALLQLTRPDTVPDHLLDPFCGAGTVLSEASARWPEARLAGVDRRAEAAKGTRENLAHAGAIAEVRVGDARALHESWPPATFDTIVTNPPFGKRLGRRLDLGRFYGDVLGSVAAVARPGARLGMLAYRRGAFNRALQANGAWSTRHVRVLELGGLYVGVFVLQRR